MAHLNTAEPEQLEASAPMFQRAEARMGFIPNSLKIMARNPALLEGFMTLSGAVMGPGSKLDPGLLQMIAHITSAAAGCRYCQAHTAHVGEKRGVAAEKIAAVWMFETSPLFNEAERAALALAQAGGSMPNQAEGAHFDALKTHFSEDEIVEIVGVVAYFGFLNRWNDTLATDLEDSPLAFAEAHLAAQGWEKGKHG